MSKFNQFTWIGSTVLGGITLTLIVLVFSAINWFKPTDSAVNSKTKEIQPPCDTIKVEVIKEVPVPCTLPHVQPKKVVKNEPIDTSKSNI